MYEKEKEWAEEKNKQMEEKKFLPNLPYLIDDGFYLTETNIILKYISEKSKN